MDHFDVIIIGTGAGGGTLAGRLAGTGKRILILERGGFLPRERENWNAEKVRLGRYRSGEQWLDKDGTEFEPFTHYWVGGNTKMYGAALLRLRESDFGEVEHYDGISPAWPLSYGDFEPYYSRAERLYSVHGRRGADPSDPPSTGAYPFEPLTHEPRIQELYDDLQKAGLRPFPLPIGVRLPTDTSKEPEVRLSNFDGFPDLTEAKADAQVVSIRGALQHPNVELRTHREVRALVTDDGGRVVTEVRAVHRGVRETYRAATVVVACGAINSAALLLRSANEQHPNGLANSSDLVGRNYMAHNNGSVIAISETPNRAQFQKTFGLTDYYHGAEDSKFPLGTVQLMGKTDLVTLGELAGDLGAGRSIEDLSRHSVDFWLTAEDLPRKHNRVRLASDGRIQVDYTPNNVEAYTRLRAKLVRALEKCGCPAHLHGDSSYVGYELSVSGVSHQNGTLCFGEDPKTSVLDTMCRAHDVDNLYVVDGSFFCSSGAVNPSLTIMANALRVGDHLAESMR